jgi:hypothetical protein
MKRLYDAYKANVLRKYASGGLFSGDEQTDEERQQFSQTVGTAAGLASGVLDAVGTPDPLSGRQSTGITIGKSALKGAAAGVGALTGVLTAGRQKKAAIAQLNSEAAMKTMNENNLSMARLASNPSLYEGYANAGYFATGGTIGDPPTNPGSRDPYYEASARVAYYKQLLNDKLKAKDPRAYDAYFKGLGENRASPQARDKYVQETGYDVYLSPDEIVSTIGAGKHKAFLDDIRTINKYNIAQGKQPLYGEIEGNSDPSRLNYGRRFASLQITPSLDVTSTDTRTGDVARSYSRSYTYNPGTGNVDVQQSGDESLTPSYVRRIPMNDKKGTAPAAVAQAPRPKGRALGAAEVAALMKQNGNELTGFATGGQLDAPLSRKYMQGGYARSLSSDGTEILGNSHRQGGVKIPEAGAEVEGGEVTKGNYVFSDRLGFAKEARKLATAKGKIEQKPMTEERVNSIRLLNRKENQLILAQEYFKQQHKIA